MSKDGITEAESHEGARGLIGLCQLIVDFKREKQKNLKEEKLVR